MSRGSGTGLYDSAMGSMLKMMTMTTTTTTTTTTMMMMMMRTMRVMMVLGLQGNRCWSYKRAEFGARHRPTIMAPYRENRGIRPFRFGGELSFWHHIGRISHRLPSKGES